MKRNQYIKIYEQVKRQIIHGQHAIDTLLPTERVLAKQFRVSCHGWKIKMPISQFL